MPFGRILFGCVAAVAVLGAVSSARAAVSLDPCPDSPNCVSSLEPADRKNHIAPLAFEGPALAAWDALRKALPTVEGFHEILWAGDEKIHAVFKTSLLGFKDDVTFLLDAEGSIVHVRSASRLGWFDFGANRDRVERIRKALPAPFSQ
ncbi:MAG: DUF1499 domain-containing protein [Oceanidesulfovibrio sp.]